MKTLFLGSGDFGCRSLLAMQEAGFAPVLVVSQPPRRRRRGGREEPTPVHAAALTHGITAFTPESVNSEEALQRLRAAGADLFVVAEYGQILKDPLLEIPALGSINVHSSLLPRHRGATPVVAALLAGDTETGVSIQRVVRRLDAGPVLAETRIPISPRDDAGTLTERLALLGGELLVEVLAAFARGEPPVAREQEESLATHCRRIGPEGTRIDWSAPATDLDRFVRAMHPRPGSRCTLLRDPPIDLRILRAEATTGEFEAGVVAGTGEEFFDVGTGAGLLRIFELTPAAKRAMSARDFLNGYRLQIGERLR